MLGLTVHAVERLPLDEQLVLMRPVVRIHIVDSQTGKYLRRKSLDSGVPPEAQGQPVHAVMATDLDAGGVSYPVRHTHAAQTAPQSLQRYRNGATLQAVYEEQMLFHNALNDLLDVGAVLLFEVLQPPVSLGHYKDSKRAFRAVGGDGVPVAWGFLKIRSKSGAPHLLDRGTVQLFAPTARAADHAEAARVKGALRHLWAAYRNFVDHETSKAPGRHSKQLGTLRLSVFAVERRLPKTVVARRGVIARPEMIVGAGAGYEIGEGAATMQGSTGTPSGRESAVSGVPARIQLGCGIPELERGPGKACEVPTGLMHALRPSAQTQGVMACRMSRTGRLVAVATASAPVMALDVYRVATGEVVASFRGHHATVYDVEWSYDDHQVMTASADYAAKVWDVGPHELLPHRGDVPLAERLSLQHPCFVYAAVFMPRQVAGVAIGVTGGFDGCLRVWDLSNGVQLQSLRAHADHVNAIACGWYGRRMFSADGGGIVSELAFDERAITEPPDARYQCLVVTRQCADLSGEPIVCLRIMPDNVGLLALTKTSRLVKMSIGETRTFTVAREYLGAACSTLPLRFDVSPDGRYIAAGLEVGGGVMIWEVDSGDGAHVPALGHGKAPVLHVSWSPTDQVVTTCTMTSGHQARVWAAWPGQEQLPAQWVAAPEGRTPMRPGARKRWRVAGSAAVLAGGRRGDAAAALDKASEDLPERLTPEDVARMLQAVRVAIRSKPWYDAELEKKAAEQSHWPV
ncbi:unnamed protein product [Pedinophyceae sp. YPF-701]|nr:unnamed protein product [Pedinophyceae sp. YPF-701]